MKFYIISVFLVIIQLNFIHNSILKSKETSLNVLIQRIQKGQKDLNQFGKELIQALELNLKSGGKFDKVLQMINQLNTELQSQQQTDDDQYTKKNNQWKKEIKNLNSQIDTLKKQIAIDLKKQEDFNSQLLQKKEKKSQVEKSHEKINQKLNNLVEARKNDKQAFETRQNEQKKVQDALQQIINSLKQKLENGSFLQVSDVVNELNKIGRENPVLAMIKLTMSFNKKDVENIIKKLEQILEGITNSLSEDVDDEQKEKNNYQPVKSKIENIIDNLKKELKKINQKISIFEDELEKQKEELQRFQKTLKIANTNLKDIEQEKLSYIKKYEQNKKKRNEQIQNVDQVKNILQGIN